MYDSNTVSYSVDSKEYCINLNRPYYRPDSMQVNIPALMPHISVGIPQQTSPITIDSTMFANASECRPRPSTKVSTQNYITITRWANEHPAFPDKADINNIIYRYSKFLVDIMNGDIRNMHICNYV